MAKTTKIYKIRNTQTELFSLGGTRCDSRWGWSKRGKTWSSSGAIRGHLNIYVDPYCHPNKKMDVNNIPVEWEVIETVIDVDAGTAAMNVYSAREFYAMSKETTYAKSKGRE